MKTDKTDSIKRCTSSSKKTDSNESAKWDVFFIVEILLGMRFTNIQENLTVTNDGCINEIKQEVVSSALLLSPLNITITFQK